MVVIRLIRRYVGPGFDSRRLHQVMGIKLFSQARYDCPSLGNPNPTRFKILKTKQVGHYLIAIINYPDSTNFEGNKILVYRDITDSEFRNLRVIDPHFSNEKGVHSPIARFEPTIEGMNIAKLFVNALVESE